MIKSLKYKDYLVLEKEKKIQLSTTILFYTEKELKKIINNKTTYLIAECKNRNKIILAKEIKCFVIKANIIAENYIQSHSFKKESKPFFRLVIISLKGFPIIDLDPIIKKYWKLPKNRIIDQRLELIDSEDFLKLLRSNNISIKKYQILDS